MTGEIFDDLADIYEAMVDWPRRLAHEEGFYRWLFDRIHARSVLDVACGTGHHAAMFHGWGLKTQGADVSESMIGRARAGFGEPAGLRWAVRGFDQPVAEAGGFDVALCVGNSLALAGSLQAAEVAIGQMLAAVRPGGAIVVHVMNLWRLPDGPPVWQKCQRTALPQGESLIIKGVHRCGRVGFVDLLLTHLDGPIPLMKTQAVAFLGLEAADLEGMARQAGAGRVEFFGDYQRRSYERSQSQDLILLAIK